MEKLIATFDGYSIFKADAKCINELSRFIVMENYKHHIGSVEATRITDDITDVTKEELSLWSMHSRKAQFICALVMGRSFLLCASTAFSNLFLGFIGSE